MTEVLEVFAPTSSVTSGELKLAARLDSLAGKRIGLLFNSKPNADELLQRVREHVASTFPDTEFVLRSKPTAAKPMVPEVFEALSACDAVVNAFGD